MIPRPCGGVNENLLAYGAGAAGGAGGDQLFAAWAEDPAESPAHGAVIEAWNQPGSLGGSWGGGAVASNVLWNEYEWSRPTFYFPGDDFLVLTGFADQVTPLTIVAVALQANLAAAAPVLSVWQNAGVLRTAGFLTVNTTVPGMNPSYSADSDPGGPAVASFARVVPAANMWHVYEGNSVPAANARLTMDTTPVAQPPACVQETFDTVQIGALVDPATPISLFYTGPIAFIAGYASETAPAGLLDAIKAHYGIVP